MGLFFYLHRSVQEVLPPSLDSTSQPPYLFNRTTIENCDLTLLYCPKVVYQLLIPYAQRVWITRNVKGLQDKIKLVQIDLQNRPDWYKEKVYPTNKVPSLEHYNKVIRESLDLVKYVDSNFEGSSLLLNVRCKIVPGVYRSFGRDVDITHAPFIEKFQIFMPKGFNYDVTTGRPKLAKWIEEMNKLDGYKHTKVLEHEKMVDYYKNCFTGIAFCKA
ncbi:hypothetical protein R3W88_033769 [Solanum pinnatisectum]|uniref:GST N-terminal domain-containing protein n=1 Tax=Solanum pinnatisectum TaxID=50273 RepID=A0AAV9K1V3_9SOLN|nr:hypothetical protein R3W88_033769 [Solanum pinnatisectum]